MQTSIFRRGLSLMLALTALLALGLTAKAETQETTPAIVALKAEHVTLPDGEHYGSTGQEIRPAVTVTVEGQTLTEDTHYTLTFADNIQPGQAKITVTGIATAGYCGTVEIPFTIEKAPEAPTQPETQPTEKPEETTRPTEKPEETTKPTEKPEETTQPTEKPEETKPVSYKLTKGDGSKWRKDSKKDLPFTVNAETRDIASVLVDGKALDKSAYTLGKDGLVTLKASYLQKLSQGSHTLRLSFADGHADGKFTVAKAADPSNPATGDNITLWISLLGLSAAAGTALFILKKRSV